MAATMTSVLTWADIVGLSWRERYNLKCGDAQESVGAAIQKPLLLTGPLSSVGALELPTPPPQLLPPLQGIDGPG